MSDDTKCKRELFNFEDSESQSTTEEATSEDVRIARSVSERSMPPTGFVSRDQEDHGCDNTKSDITAYGFGSLQIDSSNSLSGSESASRQDPTSFDIASQGLGTQFEESSPANGPFESVTLPTKDEAESISDGVIRARGRLLSSLCKQLANDS